MSFACHLHALVFYLYLRVSHSYVSRMYGYPIRMSLVCTRMSSVCHSSVVLPWTHSLCKFNICWSKFSLTSIFLNLETGHIFSSNFFVVDFIKIDFYNTKLKSLDPETDPWGNSEANTWKALSIISTISSIMLTNDRTYLKIWFQHYARNMHFHNQQTFDIPDSTTLIFPSFQPVW